MQGQFCFNFWTVCHTSRARLSIVESTVTIREHGQALLGMSLWMSASGSLKLAVVALDCWPELCCKMLEETGQVILVYMAIFMSAMISCV